MAMTATKAGGLLDRCAAEVDREPAPGELRAQFPMCPGPAQ
jgi:hypothetical protein